ncbi:MAG: 1-phosphofructokinase [Erysipelotrichaceae bacterium]|nr:1-phosphofructokinase [Erysipelotrichaceae bacterium]
MDYVIQVEHFKPGQINRNKSENIYFGGKGLNVSCILNELGFQSTALGFIAGFTGKALSDGLKQMGIVSDFIIAEKGMTRINVKMKSDEETEINGTGPVISDENFEELKNKIRNLSADDTLVLSGSIPSCMASDTYEKIIECLHEDVRLVVDAEKDLLLKVLKYRPFLIKPNNLELGEMFGTKITSEDEIVYYAKKLQEKGARNVLVSMAKDGAVLLDENGNVSRMGVAEGTVVNSVGAGDSMVAGFLAGYLEKGDYAWALKLGTACGGATAFHSGLAVKEEIMAVLETL